MTGHWQHQAWAAGLAVGLLAATVAGCATDKMSPERSNSRYSAVAVNVANSGPVCLITALTPLQDERKQVAVGDLPTALQKYQVSTDAQSFVAKATLAEMPGLRPWTKALSDSTPLIVIANHGDDLEAPVAGAGKPSVQLAPAEGRSATGQPPNEWSFYIFDALTLDPVLRGAILEPASCIRG